jgi:hypothetical protein
VSSDSSLQPSPRISRDASDCFARIGPVETCSANSILLPIFVTSERIKMLK